MFMVEVKMTEFTNDEILSLYEAVDYKLGLLFKSRMSQKIENTWDEIEEELYWVEFKKYKPLWEKLHKIVEELK
jgi:hypothetical protein